MKKIVTSAFALTVIAKHGCHEIPIWLYASERQAS